MKPETRIQLNEAHVMLDQARNLNDAGSAPAAIENAYNGSIRIAAAYMLEVEGKQLPLNDDTYYAFAKTIDKPEKHPEFSERIMDVVRSVSFLHEAYEPALLPETTPRDALQMINHVDALENLIENVLR
jgi:hypothetical protein